LIRLLTPSPIVVPGYVVDLFEERALAPVGEVQESQDRLLRLLQGDGLAPEGAEQGVDVVAYGAGLLFEELRHPLHEVGDVNPQGAGLGVLDVEDRVVGPELLHEDQAVARDVPAPWPDPHLFDGQVVYVEQKEFLVFRGRGLHVQQSVADLAFRSLEDREQIQREKHGDHDQRGEEIKACGSLQHGSRPRLRSCAK